MDLLLWRHAEAEDGEDDLKRRLTERGEKQARDMAGMDPPASAEGYARYRQPGGTHAQTAEAPACYSRPCARLVRKPAFRS